MEEEEGRNYTWLAWYYIL